MTATEQRFILTLSCPDTVGIVAAVAGELAAHAALITEAQHFREPVSNRTVLRIVFEPEAGSPFGLEGFSEDFAKVAGRFGMNWKIRDAAERLTGPDCGIAARTLSQEPVAPLGDRNVAGRYRRRALQS